MQPEQKSIITAIKLFVKLNQNQKKSNLKIIISIFGLAIGLICHQYLAIKKYRVMQKRKTLLVQVPLHLEELVQLNKEWGSGDLRNLIYLTPQYRKNNNLGIFKNICIRTTFDVPMDMKFILTSYSNVLARENAAHSIQNESFAEIQPLAKFKRCTQKDMTVDFITNTKCMRAGFIAEIDEFKKHIVFEAELQRNLEKQGKKQSIITGLMLNSFVNLLFGDSTYYFKGAKISWHLPLTIKAHQPVYMNCTAIVSDDGVRLTNVLGIGSTFEMLRYAMISRYNFRINILQNRQKFIKFLIGTLSVYLIYQLICRLGEKLHLFALRQEYPGVQNCTEYFDFAKRADFQLKSFYKCTNCKDRQADFVFVPCYHLQNCRDCFVKTRELKCQKCNEMRYCGIMIYNVK